MQKTNIDWADMSWNPITGCLHGCSYCYARGIAHRFKGFEPRCGGEEIPEGKGNNPGHIADATHGQPLHVFSRQPMRRRRNGDFVKASFPYNFDPTLHKYRLDEPERRKKPQNIFVCSMADLFGEWVPDEWIKAVFEATSRAPQHNYLYLTKNPDRYYQLREGDENVIPDNGVTGFFGASACTEKQAQSAHENINVRWMSLEPIHGVFSEDFFCHDTLVADGFFDTVRRWDWIVVGAETGNKKNKIIPKHEWIESLVRNCKAVSTPIFMKDSLADIWNEPLIQEFPW